MGQDSKGFNLDITLPDTPGLSGPVIPQGLRADSIQRTEPIVQHVQLHDRVELFAYFIKFPFFDYWVWDRVYHIVERFVSDQDATAPYEYFSLNPELVFTTDEATGTPTDAQIKEMRTKALFETIKQYYHAIHYFVAAVSQALLWANMRGFPIADRLMSKLKVNTLSTIVQQIDGFPITSSAYNYLLKALRILEFRPESGVLIHAYPIWLYEHDSYVEGWGTTSRRTLLPTIQEMVDADPGSGGLNPSSDGMLADYFYNRIDAARTYLTETLGFKNSVIKIGSKLRDLFDKLGAFDTTFSWDKLLSDVNAQPVYEGWDFVGKSMIFADRPRPILKHKNSLHYPPSWGGATDREDSLFDKNPWTYVDALVDETYLYDNYEYLKIPDTDEDFNLVLNTQNWDNDGVVLSSEAVDASLDEDSGFEVVGGQFIDHIFKQWFSPYHDFYVSDPEYLIKDTVAERGLMYMVKDEYIKGIFQPRYAVTPLIDNMDIFQCGFYKVLMTEWNDDDPWSAYATVWENDEITPVAIWADHHATLKDALFWVGGGFAMPPSFSVHHSLAAQASYLAEAEVSDLDADETLAAMPFTPFIYHYYWDSLTFTLPSSGWDSDDDIFADTTNKASFDHTFEVTSATRRVLWRALDYFDPFRPNRVRIAGWITNMISLFSDRIQQVTSDIGTLLQNLDVNTVSLDKDNSRYLSKYRIMGIDKPPLIAGKQNTRPSTGRYGRQPKVAPEPKTSIKIGQSAARETMDVITGEQGILDAIANQYEFVTGNDIRAELEMERGLGKLKAIVAAAAAYTEGVTKGATTANIEAAKRTYDKIYKELTQKADEYNSRYAEQKRGGGAR
jgi:hypothetical protein